MTRATSSGVSQSDFDILNNKITEIFHTIELQREDITANSNDIHGIDKVQLRHAR